MIYQQYDLKKKDFDDAYTKFILASGKLSEASELLFLNASKYIQKWTIDNVQVEEYLENQLALDFKRKCKHFLTDALKSSACKTLT